MEFPTIMGICGCVALITLITVNIFTTKAKPFTGKWFYALISFIPEEDEEESKD